MTGIPFSHQRQGRQMPTFLTALPCLWHSWGSIFRQLGGRCYSLILFLEVSFRIKSLLSTLSIKMLQTLQLSFFFLHNFRSMTMSWIFKLLVFIIKFSLMFSSIYVCVYVHLPKKPHNHGKQHPKQTKQPKFKFVYLALWFLTL